MSDEEQQPEQIKFDAELRKYARADPFLPFDILTTSRTTIGVTDSIQIAVGESTVVVVLPRTGTQLIRKNQIVALHLHEPVK